RRDRRGHGLVARSQEPARTSPPPRALRIRLGSEPRKQKRAVGAEGRAASHLRQGEPLARGEDQGRARTCQSSRLSTGRTESTGPALFIIASRARARYENENKDLD